MKTEKIFTYMSDCSCFTSRSAYTEHRMVSIALKSWQKTKDEKHLHWFVFSPWSCNSVNIFWKDAKIVSISQCHSILIVNKNMWEKRSFFFSFWGTAPPSMNQNIIPDQNLKDFGDKLSISMMILKKKRWVQILGTLAPLRSMNSGDNDQSSSDNI